MGRKLNVALIKEEYEKSQGGGNADYWKPTEGKTSTIRLVPTEDGNPFKRYSYHYRIGGEGSFLCPKKNFGEPCAVCDLVYELFKSEDEGDIKMAKDLMAKPRWFTPVVDREQEEPIIKIWGYGKRVYDDLYGFATNPQYGDALIDEFEGLDLDVKYYKEDKARFPTTKVEPFRKESPLLKGKTEEEVEEFLASAPDIESMAMQARRTSEEVRAILEKHLNGDAAEVAETSKYGSDDADKSSVDEAFEDLNG